MVGYGCDGCWRRTSDQPTVGIVTLALHGLEEPAHASRGLEEPFSSCAVVSVFGSGGK